MKLESLTRRLIHLRQVANHIDSNLEASLTLDQLADVAHLSRFHFERVFADYAGETPLARVRRLRLDHAKRRIEQGQINSLLDLAMDIGYSSAEAFSRAFRTQFGCAPSSLTQQDTPEAPAIRIETLPELPIQYLPFEGAQKDAMHAFDELRARAILQNIPRERRKGWRIELARADDGHTVKLQAAFLSQLLGTEVPGLLQGNLPAGEYAVITLRGRYETPDLATLAQRISNETGYQLRDAPLLQSFHNANYLPSQPEKRCDLYVPIKH